MDDIQKIKLVHRLVNTVIRNQAKAGTRYRDEEQKASKTLLEVLLGRKPSKIEADAAVSEIWMLG